MPHAFSPPSLTEKTPHFLSFLHEFSLHNAINLPHTTANCCRFYHRTRLAHSIMVQSLASSQASTLPDNQKRERGNTESPGSKVGAPSLIPNDDETQLPDITSIQLDTFLPTSAN